MPTPIDIRPVGSGELLLTWDDEHRSLFSCRYLRYLCPCAQCVDERTGRRLIILEKVPADIHIIKTEAVGLYAVRFQWSDGHSTGIYGFEFLRKNCPCTPCATS